jgi:hypothetical protein
VQDGSINPSTVDTLGDYTLGDHTLGDHTLGDHTAIPHPLAAALALPRGAQNRL